jgi:DNA-binding NarL/FixJ family response regulator
MLVHVAVSDPLPMFRHGVMATLHEAGFVSEAPEDLLVWIGDAQRKVIFLTLRSPDDWTLLVDLRRARADLLVIGAVEDATTSAYVRALTAGAVGVLPRSAPPGDVRDAFAAATSGRSVLPIDVVRALTDPARDSRPDGDIPSPREIDWLHQLAGGLTVGQLAARVGYSERMMFRLLRELYDRLQVKGRTEALMLARQRGWL